MPPVDAWKLLARAGHKAETLFADPMSESLSWFGIAAGRDYDTYLVVKQPQPFPEQYEKAAPFQMRKVKKQQRKGDLPLSAGTASLDDETKSLQAERENAMIMEDKLVQDTENEKNNLESMIYELKDKIIDQYKDFASDDEKSRLNAKLEQIEVC